MNHKIMKELRSNRGSGVVLVMVAISCITMMVVSLMLLSYTGFKIKAADRLSKEDLYMTEAKIEQLVGCLQNEASKAIGEAQKRALIDYDTASMDNAVVETQKTQEFKTAYLDELEDALVNSATGTYSGAELQNLLNDSTVTIANDAECTYEIDTTEYEFILKNVRVSCKGEKSGNITTISTDIVIMAPDFHYIKADAVMSGDNSEWKVEELIRYENWSVN